MFVLWNSNLYKNSQQEKTHNPSTMKRTLNFFIGVMTTLLMSFQANASHIMGGDVSYSWLGGNDYQFELTLYRDCSGIPAPANFFLYMSSQSCGLSDTLTLTQVNGTGQEITPICPGVQSTCNGGTAMGVQKYVYQATTTLAGNCSDWVFYSTDCCRNASITNILTPGSYGIYISATLDNLNFPFNNSPSFGNDPIVFLTTGSTHTINNGAFDLDGDSLAISLTSALDMTGYSVNYASGFSPTNPIMSSPAMVTNPFNGDITVTPTQMGVDVVVYKVDEYRNGQLISSVSRDIQVIINNSTNQLPSISGINGSGSFVTSVCAGNTLQFTIQSSDADAVDSTFISIQSPGNLNPSILSFGGQQDSVSITLPTDTSMISAQAYIFYITVNDNACPYKGQQQYAIEVYINACSQDVWPGDANSDLTCDLYDLLPIGVAYGASGPVRSGASTAWVAQPSTDWGQTLASSVDYKHVDCNGDGIIDANDTTAIGLNYGQTHPLRLAPMPSIDAVNNIYLIASRDSAGPSDTFAVQTVLGSSMNPVSAIYGIAFRVEFSPTVVDSTASSLQFINSSLGTPGTDLLTFVRPNWAAGFIDAVAVRTDHSNVSSDSTISLFDVVIIDNVSARMTCNFRLSKVRGIMNDGTIQNFVPIDDSVNIASSTTGIAGVDAASNFFAFPNPARDIVTLYSKAEINAVSILDLTGKQMMKIRNYTSGTSIDVSSLPQGCYILRTENNSGLHQKLLNITR